jgi:phytoene synthase
MIEGQLMDVNEIMLKPERNIFYLYCYRVASCVGIVTSKILGYKEKNEAQVIRFATHLGKGFQIVNILRDIHEDANVGRIYIPQRILMRNKLVEVDTDEIAENFSRYREQFARASAELAELAKEHFVISEESLPMEERENMKIPLLMRGVYTKYLQKMQDKGYIFDKKDIRLSWLDKIKIFS